MTATDDKIEETIKAIAAKHGIAVGRDDPILILQTLNERLMQDSLAAQEALLGSFRSELEEVAHRWNDETKRMAERTLKGTLAASKSTMEETMLAGATKAADSIRKELETFAERFSAVVREAQRVATMNLIAAGMAIVAAGLVVWSAV